MCISFWQRSDFTGHHSVVNGFGLRRLNATARIFGILVVRSQPAEFSGGHDHQRLLFVSVVVEEGADDF